MRVGSRGLVGLPGRPGAGVGGCLVGLGLCVGLWTFADCEVMTVAATCVCRCILPGAASVPAPCPSSFWLLERLLYPALSPRLFLALQAIDAGRRQYAELLADLGFIPASYASAASAAGGRGGGGGRRGGGGGMSASVSNPYGEGEEKPLHEVDEQSANARTVKAALCCGFYPQVG